MFNWFKVLNKVEKRTLYACFGGWALDAMDTQIYSFLIPTLVAAWAMTSAQAGALGTAALVSSSIGGWVAGILCDRVGRVRMMLITIAWFAFFTIMSGCANSYDQLLVARIMSGIGFGGEWAAGSVLMGEVIRAESRGKAVGIVQSSYAIGYAIAALMSAFLFTAFPPDIAWRAMFWIGASPAVLVWLIRRGTPEPDVFLQEKAKRAKTGQHCASPLAIFHPGILRTTVLTSLLAIGVQGGGFALGMWLPTFLKTAHHISTVNVGYFMFIFTAGSFAGYVASAYLCDAVGRRRNFLIYVIVCWLAVPALFYLPIDGNVAIGAELFAAGFGTLGIYTACGPYFTELFPTALRGNGQGFAYNIGRAVGAFLPMISGILQTSGLLHLREAVAGTTMAAYLFIIVAIIFLPETCGRDLSTVAGVGDAEKKDADQAANASLSHISVE